MKDKIKRIVGIFTMLVILLCVITACGDRKITSLKIKEGTLQYMYLQNAEYSFDNLKVIVSYNDDTTEEVGKDKLTISEFSTATIGDHKVTITYETKSIEVTLKVTNNEDEYYTLNGIELPQSIVNRNNNTSVQENKETEFYVRDNVYVVGDDNPFVFFPNLTALDDNDELMTINKYRSISKIYIKNSGNNYDLVSEETVATYVAIDEMNSSYDFTEEAIGKQFKLEVRPYYLNEEQLLEVDQWTLSLEFKVVDGYNVTDAKELGLMNNYDDSDNIDSNLEWTTFLANANITKPADLKGLVLHNDLEVTVKDLPSAFVVNNHLRDYLDLYTHKVALGGEFKVYGNYFTIDFSKLPLVDTETASDGVSHSSVFKTYMDAEQVATYSKNSVVSFENLSLIGNANRVDNEEGFGGLIMNKAHSHKVVFDNVIIKTFYINTYMEYYGANLNLNHVKSYDAYQGLIFSYGGNDLTITNSELKRAGGPAMILQHVDPNKSDCYTCGNNSIPNVVVDENTTIESYVAGTEAWFRKLGLDKIAAQIMGLNATFGSNGSFVKTENGVNKMNIIAINMTSGMGLGGQGAQGKLVVGGKEVVNLMKNENADTNLILDVTENKAPVFKTSDGGLGYIISPTENTYLLQNFYAENDYIETVATGDKQLYLKSLNNAQKEAALSTGDYIGLYYEGIGISLGYFHN